MGTLSWLAVASALAGCGSDRDFVGDGGTLPDAFDPYTLVASAPVTVNRDVDLLFVIDDSPGSLAVQTALKSSFDSLENVLITTEGGMPNIHLGVVSTDLGTKGALDAQAGPGIGSGPGSCSGNGKAGTLQTNGSVLLNGNFINDQKNSDGTRTTNYTGALDSVFDAVASLGATGCSFVQPAQAAKRALNNNPSNAGFLRQTAHLALVFIGTHDDCSMAHSTLLGADTNTLGPLTPFRCTRFGVTCDTSGATSDAMAMPGVKSSCHANEQSLYLDRISDDVAFVKGLKPAMGAVYAAAIVGPASPFEVVAGPTLAPSCDAGGITAQPATRMRDFIEQLDGRFESACGADLSAQLTRIGMDIRTKIGHSCVTHPLGPTPDCHAYETTPVRTTELPACATTSSTECWRLVTDAQQCVLPPNLRLEVSRSMPPALDTVVSLRCRL